MNQILSIENKVKTKNKKEKNKSNEPIKVETIIKFFVITIIAFGVCLTGSASYGLVQEMKHKQEQNTAKPVISVEKYDETSVVIKVNHDKILQDVTYRWNNDPEAVINVDQKNYIEEVISLPSGTNTLTITATDVDGASISCEKQYVAGNAPKIDLTVEGNNIKATVSSTEGVAYITYRWDEGEETKIDVNNNQIEKLIEIPKGLHTLTIISVDINNNTQTKTQEVNGVTKPKLEVTTDGQNFVISASDEEGLSKLEFILNGQGYRMALDGKDLNYSYPLQDGENKLEVTIYNKSGVTETFKAKCTK